MPEGNSRARGWLDWECSEQGQFALEKQKHLLLHLASRWRRRGQVLLEIECHSGFFLEGFWESGFDVSGVDRSPEMLNRARVRLGKRADLHVGHPEELSFEDKSFDYVVAVFALDQCMQAGRVVKEAARICKKELLLGFLNKRSCASLGQILPDRWSASSASREGPWRTAGETRRLIKENLGMVPVEGGSVLLGPKLTWRRKPFAERMNGIVLPVPLGSFCALRLDLTWERTGTPLIAWDPTEATKAAHSVQPASHRPAM
jgi:SAM-dependent methyltransferase